MTPEELAAILFEAIKKTDSMTWIEHDPNSLERVGVDGELDLIQIAKDVLAKLGEKP